MSDSSPAPAEDVDLAAIFQAAIAGITQLSGDLVRPRWQPNPPRIPSNTVNWCALGATVETPDAGPFLQCDPNDADSMLYWRHEQIEILATFYGPNSKTYAKRLRDGIAIPQNCEGLQANNIALVDVAAMPVLNEQINQQWYLRHDQPLTFTRKVIRTYPVGRFVYSNVQLRDDSFLNRTIVVGPKP